MSLIQLLRTFIPYSLKRKIYNAFLVHAIEAATEFSHHYFDWINIDPDHSYETTLGGLIGYKNKIKVGDYSAGHNFVKGNFNTLIKFGVLEAVLVSYTKENWELAFITLENNEKSSSALKQLL